MKDTDSNQKEPIQDLLAAKQKEKPGDEFFENFSEQILTRLEEPAPKPTLWERLNENVDPFRAAAALFAVAVGFALIIGLDEGSTIAESEPVPLGQAEQELMADVVAPPGPTPAPPGQSQGTLAGVGMAPPKKVKPQPPLMLLKPGTGVKSESANYKNRAVINKN